MTRGSAHTDIIGSRLGRVLGVTLLVHFAAICAIKSSAGVQEQVWWISNAALVVAGIGLWLRSALLVAAPLTLIAIPHTLWLIDFCLGFPTGSYPMGMTSYLAHADAWAWIATAHHFYLVPLLLIVVLRHGRYPQGAAVLAAALFLVFTIVSRFALPPASNVNSAFAVLPRVDNRTLRWMETFDSLSYLLVLNGAATVGLFMPVAVVLARRDSGFSVRVSG